MRLSAEVIVSLILFAAVPPTASRSVTQRLHTTQVGIATVDVSADGRFVAFESWAPLSPEDTNTNGDIYLLDRTAGRITLESVSWAGGAANGTSVHPRLSGDGRFVVFSSVASNLIPLPDESLRDQVFLRDRQTGRTMLISRAAAGGMNNGSNFAPEISGDGRFIAFVSTATDLVSDPDANGAYQDVYRFDVETRAVVRTSVDDHGTQHHIGVSFAPAISGDGRFVAFTSSASLDLGMPPAAPQDGRAGRASQVFVRDLDAGSTRLASRTAAGRAGNGTSFRPAISDDGRVVAFVSSATDLVRSDRNGLPDVFLYELMSGRITLVSRTAGGERANGRSDWPALSSDGRYVAFVSEASNLICAMRCPRGLADQNLVADVFVADSVTGEIARVSGWDAEGGPWWEPSLGPAVDATARLVAFSSRHPIDDADIGIGFRPDGASCRHWQALAAFDRLTSA